MICLFDETVIPRKFRNILLACQNTNRQVTWLKRLDIITTLYQHQYDGQKWKIRGPLNFCLHIPISPYLIANLPSGNHRSTGNGVKKLVRPDTIITYQHQYDGQKWRIKSPFTFCPYRPISKHLIGKLPFGYYRSTGKRLKKLVRPDTITTYQHQYDGQKWRIKGPFIHALHHYRSNDVEHAETRPPDDVLLCNLACYNFQEYGSEKRQQQQTFDNITVSLPCFTGKAAEWKQCIKHVRNWACHMTLKEPLSDKLLHYITWEIVLFLLILMLCAWTFAKTLVSFLQRISSNSAGQGWLRILTLLLPGQCEEDRYNEQECADSVEPSEDNLGGIYGEDIAHPPILVAGAAGGDDGDRNNRRDRNYRDDRIHPEENGIEEVDNNELPVECTEGNDDTTNTEVTPEPAIGGVDDEFERATNLDIAGAHYAAIPEAIEDIAQQAVDEQAPMEYDVMAQPAENNLLFGYGEPCSDEEEIRQDTIVHFPDDQD